MCQTWVLMLTSILPRSLCWVGSSHVPKTEEYSWPGTMIPPPYVMFHSSPGVGLVISPLTFKNEKMKEENIYTYFHLLFLFLLLSKLLHKNLNKVKLGLTLEYRSQWSRHFCRVIFREIIAIWLSFDSLFLFTTEPFNFLKKGEKVQITHLKEIWVRGLVIFREGINTLNIRSTLREPFDFILLLVL